MTLGALDHVVEGYAISLGDPIHMATKAVTSIIDGQGGGHLYHYNNNNNNNKHLLKGSPG